MKKSEKITFTGIVLNFLLFILKISAGVISRSNAVISDAINSFIDVTSSVCIYISVKVSNKRADTDHPYGHARAEPIAAMLVAMLTAIFAFEIGKAAVLNFFSAKQELVAGPAVFALLITIVVKAAMSYYFLKKGKDRPAIKASGIDSRNDVIVSSIALMGVVLSMYGYNRFDDIAAFIISIFIFYSGYRIGRENIDYLMGKSPSGPYIENVRWIAGKVNGVKGINEVKAHYVGNKIHVEVHIEVDKKCTTRTSHDIGKAVQKKIERLRDVDKAFIHVDPV